MGVNEVKLPRKPKVQESDKHEEDDIIDPFAEGLPKGNPGFGDFLSGINNGNRFQTQHLEPSSSFDSDGEQTPATEKTLKFKIPTIPGNSVSYVFTQWGSGKSATSFSFNVTDDKVTKFDTKTRF